MSSESEVFIGYADGASRHTRRLASAAWVIFTPQGQLLSSRGICLGDTTNNVVEYSTVIELLRDALSLGISRLQVYLDAQTGCVAAKQNIPCARFYFTPKIP
jgi:ribonuclease HI